MDFGQAAPAAIHCSRTAISTEPMGGPGGMESSTADAADGLNDAAGGGVTGNDGWAAIASVQG